MSSRKNKTKLSSKNLTFYFTCTILISAYLKKIIKMQLLFIPSLLTLPLRNEKKIKLRMYTIFFKTKKRCFALKLQTTKFAAKTTAQLIPKLIIK